MDKPWARLRKHGPCMIFDYYATEKEARQAITASFHTIAYFPDNEMSSKRRLRRNACIGLQRHATQTQAVAHLRSLLKKTKVGYEKLGTYRCSFYKGWHIRHHG